MTKREMIEQIELATRAINLQRAMLDRAEKKPVREYMQRSLDSAVVRLEQVRIELRTN